MGEISRYASESVNKLLIGNKCDIDGNRQVSFEEGKELADSLGIPFMETSAKTSENVEKTFLRIASEIKQKVAVSTSKAAPQPPKGQQLSTGKAVGGKSKQGCC